MNKYIDCKDCQNHYDCERTYLGGCTDGKELEEKKLTDEEIVKAWKYCMVYGGSCDVCPYDGEHCKIGNKDILDLINRLQKENEKQRQEIEFLTKVFASSKRKQTKKELLETIAEQKAEIERLTKEGNEAVRSFTRMETLYKIKCQELEVANKKLEELKCGKIN